METVIITLDDIVSICFAFPRKRMEQVERQLASLTGLVQTALTGAVGVHVALPDSAPDSNNLNAGLPLPSEGGKWLTRWIVSPVVIVSKRLGGWQWLSNIRVIPKRFCSYCLRYWFTSFWVALLDQCSFFFANWTNWTIPFACQLLSLRNCLSLCRFHLRLDLLTWNGLMSVFQN